MFPIVVGIVAVIEFVLRFNIPKAITKEYLRENYDKYRLHGAKNNLLIELKAPKQVGILPVSLFSFKLMIS